MTDSASGRAAASASELGGNANGFALDLNDLDGIALKHHIDFRQVYATVLQDWLGIASQPILGDPYPTLDVLKG